MGEKQHKNHTEPFGYVFLIKNSYWYKITVLTLKAGNILKFLFCQTAIRDFTIGALPFTFCIFYFFLIIIIFQIGTGVVIPLITKTTLEVFQVVDKCSILLHQLLILYFFLLTVTAFPIKVFFPL